MKQPRTLAAPIAVALLACAPWVHAGTVSLGLDRTSPLLAGETVTFSVADSRARDMFDAAAGFAAADFRFLYDTAALQFVAVTYAPWITSAASIFAADNGSLPPDGEVLLTLSGLDELAFPADPAGVFDISFIVRPAGAGSVSVLPPDVPSYRFAAPDALRFQIAGAVPLPSTLALLIPGLLAAGLARRSVAAAA